MPIIFVSRVDPTLHYSYAIGTAVSVSDDVALHAERHSWGVRAEDRVPSVQTGADTEKVAANGGPGGSGITALSAATDYTTNLVTPLAGKVSTASVGAASGVASLDGTGKVPVAQLPAAVLGALNYQGTYNATTNIPALVAGNKGFYWKTATAGTALGFTWNVGDLVVDNGTTLDKVDGIGSEVLSVAGRTGPVALTTADLTDLAATLTTPIANNTTAIVNEAATARAAEAIKLNAFIAPRTEGATVTLAPADNGGSSITPVACVVTVNTGLGLGFGRGFRGAGAVTFAGTATVSDKRVAGAANPTCALLCAGTDTYDCIGGKA